MKTYKVIFFRRGYALMEADTEAEAVEKARKLKLDQLCWSDGDLFFPAYVDAAKEERNR